MISLIVNTILILNLLAIITVIFFERKNPVTTMAWLLALNTLPLIGFMLYLLFGKGFTSKKLLSLEKREEQIVKGVVDKQPEILVEENQFIQTKQLVHMNLTLNQSLCTVNNKVKIYTQGQDKFNDLLQDLRSAKKYIHILYFILDDDQIGTQVL